jgi:dipeptidyl aminopeptidase/acylaminoacyl peptidase
MKRVLLAAALLCASPAFAQTAAPVVKTERGQLMLENVPATPPAVRERLRQYVNTRGASFQGFTPDGGILIGTRFADAAQLHKVDSPLGMRRQLTFYPEPVGGALMRPDGSGQFAFAKDTGGDEFFQAYLFDPKAGAATAFTEPGTRNQSLTWTKDGGLVAWSRSTKDSGDYDILVANPSKTDSRRVLFKGRGAISPQDFSADGKTLLLQESISVAKSRLFTLDVASQKLTELTPDLNVSYDGGAFLADGKSILTGSDEGSDFSRLVKIDLATGKRTVLTPNLTWDVESYTLARDGKTVAYVVNVAGASELRLMNAETGAELPAPKLPAGVIVGTEFDDAALRLGFSLNAATAPSDVYVLSLKDGALTRWTESEVGGLDPATFVAPKLVTFKSFDSGKKGAPKEMSAWVYAPNKPGPHPVIINIHGGPEGQSRPTFSPTIQYWVNELGVAVVLPNVRGSTGYGKTFVGLDNGLKRLDSVKDIGATLDWMAAFKQFDMNRVISYGGSYGGYMVYATMIMFPERFAGGVDIVGISHFRTFLENTSGYRRDLRRVEYGDERDPKVAKFFEEIAPLNNAAKIRKPMFVVHGQNDPRVPVSEARQMVEAFRKNGVETWVMIAKDEGHGFQKKANQEAQREAETLFFAKVLGVK